MTAMTYSPTHHCRDASRMRHVRFRRSLVATALWGTAFCSTIVNAGERTVINLRATAAPTGRAVRLGDVAELTGADAELIARLEALDLAAAETSAATIGRRFIDLRLQLAGLEESDYELRGATKVTLESATTSVVEAAPTDAQLGSYALHALSRTWSVPESELQVKLSSPVQRSLETAVKDWSAVRWELEPRGAATLGAVAMQLRIQEGDRLVAVRSIPFEVSRRRCVVVAIADVPAGATLSATSLHLDERWLTTSPDITALEQIVGLRVNQPLGAGDVVTRRHLAPQSLVDGSPRTKIQPLVKPRDVVRVTARRGSLTVTLSQAEALQAGAAGQLVRVRNVASNRVVVGKVVAVGEVEVVF